MENRTRSVADNKAHYAPLARIPRILWVFRPTKKARSLSLFSGESLQRNLARAREEMQTQKAGSG